MAYTVAQAEAWLHDPFVQAWLRVLREGESSQTDDAYTVLWGGTHFDSFADHPRIRFDLPGGNYTTAAGAYQIVEKTWNGLVSKYGFTDFTPRTQDIAAVLLTAGRGAIQSVLDGDWREACVKCRGEWASLPSNENVKGVISWDRAERVWQQYTDNPQAQGEDHGEDEETVAQAPEEVLSEQAPAPIVESVPVIINEEPKKESPVSFIAAAIPMLAQYLPSIIRLFGGNTEVTERNAKAAEAVAAVVTKAVGASNVQDAVTKVAADTALRAAAEAAIQAQWHDLTQLMGGIKAAADIDRQDMDAAAQRMVSIPEPQLRAFYVIAGMQFVLTFLVVSGLFGLIAFVVTKGNEGKDLPGWATTIIGSLFIAVALEWRSILVFVTGTNKDSSAKTALLAQMSPPKK